MARARVLRAHADSQRLSAGLGHGSCFGRGDRRRLLWNSHQRSVCGKPYLFTERRRTVPVIGEEKLLQPRVAGEGYSKHLKGLPFKILNPGPNRDQRDRFRSVSRKILLESQDQVSRLPVLKRRCMVDDLEPCLPVIVDTGDAVGMVEAQLVPEEQSNLNYFLRRHDDFGPGTAHDLGILDEAGELLPYLLDEHIFTARGTAQP